MPSLWYHRNKLNKTATRIRASIQQIKADMAEPHMVDNTYLNSLVQNVQTADTARELKLLENSTNKVRQERTEYRYRPGTLQLCSRRCKQGGGDRYQS